MKLGQILIRQGLITLSDLEAMLQLQPTKMQQLGNLLMYHGLITEAQLATALQEQYWRNHGYWVID